MRVSDIGVMSNLLAGLMNLQAQQYEIDRAVNSGLVVNAPSDNPEISRTIMDSRQSLLLVEQYTLNLESADNWLSASESAMLSMEELLNRGMVLAEQMANGTLDDLERDGAAEEVRNIIAQIITLANTTINGNYIFGGTQTQTQPLNDLLVADSPATLTSDTTTGHDVTATYEEVAPGDWRMVLGRDEAGNPITINASTLGAALGLNFNPANWTISGAGDVATHNTNLGGAGALVSNRVGETLSFTSDGVAQTLTTTGVVDFSGITGADTASVDLDTGAGPPFPLTYTATGSTDEEMAASLAEAINSDTTAGTDYYAWVENGTEVHIAALPGTTVDLTANTAPATGVMNVDQNTTAEDLADMINNGVRASGMVHLDDAALPLDIDTISIGGQIVTWEQVLAEAEGEPATAAEYAEALAGWITNNTTDFVAEASASGTGASVRVSALTVGAAGNVALTSSTADVLTSGALFGGLDGSGTGTTTSLYGQGESTLRLSTTIQATVVEVGGDAVDLMVRWYDDDGNLNSELVSLAGRGSEYAVAVDGLGGLEIYLGDQEVYSGAVFEMGLTHYQGNDGDLAINFSQNIRMDYNWNASEVLGEYMTVNLLGDSAVAGAANTGGGTVNLAGAYRGLESREITFVVVDPGTVPGDDVTLRASWVGDDGQEHNELVTLTSQGLGASVELPGCDGVSIYLDGGAFDQGDSFTASIEKEPLHVLDTLAEWAYQLENGTLEEAQTESQVALDALRSAVQSILDQVATAGIRQERILVRDAVIEEQELYHTGQLEELAEVDLVEALLQLNSSQTAYNASLKVAQVVADLSLLNELG